MEGRQEIHLAIRSYERALAPASVDQLLVFFRLKKLLMRVHLYLARYTEGFNHLYHIAGNRRFRDLANWR
jgi:hypothetical protein